MLDTWVSISQVVVLILTFLSVSVGVFELWKHFEWNKAHLTYELGKVWSEQTLPWRNIIEKEFDSYLSTTTPANVNSCEEFVKAVKGDELHDLKMAVINLLNYFEDIAMLYLNDMLDKRMVDDTLKNAIMRYYEKLLPLKECIDRLAGYKSWKLLDNLIEHWKKEDRREPSKRFLGWSK